MRWVSDNVSFDQDVEVSLFETNIRVLGGLISAHLLAAGGVKGASHLAVYGYRGELLRLAVDLGERLLSAFDGCGKLPRAFVNLKGVAPKHNAKGEQCTAGVGTLLLEFGTLSRLSLDSRFEEVRDTTRHHPTLLADALAVSTLCRHSTSHGALHGFLLTCSAGGALRTAAALVEALDA